MTIIEKVFERRVNQYIDGSIICLLIWKVLASVRKDKTSNLSSDETPEPE